MHSSLSPKVSALLYVTCMRFNKEARQKGGWVSDISFEKLLLKLEHVASGFCRMQQIFVSRAKKSVLHPATGTSEAVKGQTSCKDAKASLRELGFQVSDEDLKASFGADEGPQGLTFTDFLTVVAVTLLRKGPKVAAQEGVEGKVVNALVLAVNSFNHFDKDGNGTLQRKEVMNTLQEVDKPAHAPSRGETPAASPLQQRWQQMDWDKDGCVTLREYLAALHAWALEDFNEG